MIAETGGLHKHRSLRLEPAFNGRCTAWRSGASARPSEMNTSERCCQAHSLKCCAVQELKHLYTAVTRAKNNVIFFDRDPAKRAPFFHYLRRLGLARIVRR